MALAVASQAAEVGWAWASGERATSCWYRVAGQVSRKLGDEGTNGVQSAVALDCGWAGRPRIK